MELISEPSFQSCCARFPKPANYRPSYGTAGFRAEGNLLQSTLFRCGLLMGLRALKTGQATGIVVTASHNPAEDNGVKLVEPSGAMLLQSWEEYADRLATAEDCNTLLHAFKEICSKECISKGKATVLIAHDTRKSSPMLVEAAKLGVEALGGTAELRGLLTTPQLHWMVRRQNQGLPHSEADYYSILGGAFCRLVKGTERQSQSAIVDCANGVGAQKLQHLQQHASELQLELRNTDAHGLNHSCGADDVQKGLAPPRSFEDVPSDARCASIDGDADRVVYFTHIKGKFMLFDGDRIAVLAALLVRQLTGAMPCTSNLQLGVVQTAYANGNSTRYMREKLKLDVKLAKTGVKHLHHLAETFDIGIYFEANGHGTMLFSTQALELLRQEAASASDPAATSLLDLAEMVNQTVGDAISGILLVEAALRRWQWTVHDVAALYEDLPSCILKVKVTDKNAFTTTVAETRIVTPVGLQSKIDAAVQKTQSGRCFVRPSGTEDVVRVFAEADTIESANALAILVSELVTQFAD